MKKYILTILALTLYGCGDTYNITLDSKPRGAVVFCDGKNKGYTPVKLSYSKKSIEKKSEVNMQTCTDNWMSGYSKKYSTFKPQKSPNGVIITKTRPFGCLLYTSDAADE